jgi:hypothetical protein
MGIDLITALHNRSKWLYPLYLQKVSWDVCIMPAEFGSMFFCKWEKNKTVNLLRYLLVISIGNEKN